MFGVAYRSHPARGNRMRILMVFTSHDQLGNTGRPTGFWLEEGAAPYFVFRDAGVELTLASPKGGQPPIDPKSDKPENQTPAQVRFKKDAEAQKAFANTVRLADVKAEDFDTVFYPGGHGPMWDLAEDAVSIALLESFYSSLRSTLCANAKGSNVERSFLSSAARRASACPLASTRSHGVCAGLYTRRSFEPTRTFFTSLTEGRYRFIHHRSSWR